MCLGRGGAFPHSLQEVLQMSVQIPAYLEFWCFCRALWLSGEVGSLAKLWLWVGGALVLALAGLGLGPPSLPEIAGKLHFSLGNTCLVLDEM